MAAHRGILRRMLSSASASMHPPADPERQYTSSTLPVKPKHLSVLTSNPEDLVPAADKLLIFRTLTGIDTVPVVSSGHTTRTAANIGIYTRVVRHERAAKKMYRVIKLLASLCLGLQILFGAAVTALGAAGGSYNGITGLGACSTITASIVAYIKGSGQPDKLKHAETRWRTVREYIEQRERELCLLNCGLDVYHEVMIVEDMYQTVKEELAVKGPNQQNGTAPTTATNGAGMGGGGGSEGIPQRVNSLRGGAVKNTDGWKKQTGAGINERINDFGTSARGFVDKLGHAGDTTSREMDGQVNSLGAAGSGLVDKIDSGRDTASRGIGQHLGAVAANLREKAEDVSAAGHDILHRPVHQTEPTGTVDCRRENGCRCGAEKGPTSGARS
ncbi:uncharacterized protein J7T54_004731 [Emericellopsis cladophorae]|uniref:SMODS and SLOG-associating 2TM effector domain-containing protein n=1 Tax=Emericellopsis cladophorae TaxID=2686198 RepID=A0A9P9Y6Y3_9HYPO|nr:uncharacterized protein J7T54_004731 [Emericellopsis cladophorae]KAI6784185.1 hypothetical protein J7T54_004731 [Emericellopsis cladophorae]